jgi:hypothetical protein
MDAIVLRRIMEPAQSMAARPNSEGRCSMNLELFMSGVELAVLPTTGHPNFHHHFTTQRHHHLTWPPTSILHSMTTEPPPAFFDVIIDVSPDKYSGSGKCDYCQASMDRAAGRVGRAMLCGECVKCKSCQHPARSKCVRCDVAFHLKLTYFVRRFGYEHASKLRASQLWRS